MSLAFVSSAYAFTVDNDRTQHQQPRYDDVLTQHLLRQNKIWSNNWLNLRFEAKL